jgi:hypothetical protein
MSRQKAEPSPIDSSAYPEAGDLVAAFPRIQSRPKNASILVVSSRGTMDMQINPFSISIQLSQSPLFIGPSRALFRTMHPSSVVISPRKYWPFFLCPRRKEGIISCRLDKDSQERFWKNIKFAHREPFVGPILSLLFFYLILVSIPPFNSGTNRHVPTIAEVSF